MKYKSLINFVSDNHEIYNNLTGNEYLNFIADMYDVSRSSREKIYIPLITAFQIESYLKQPIKNYSHGTKQKISIIASLVNDPQLWVLDEPMTGLDIEATQILKKLIKDRAVKGKSILFSTHILEICEKLCDIVAFIKDGKIETIMTLQDNYSDTPLEKIYREVMNDIVLEEDN